MVRVLSLSRLAPTAIINRPSNRLTQRINGIEVTLNRTSDGFEVFHLGQRLGSVLKVQRVGEIMWQAEDSKRFRTMMTQAVEELLVRAELIDGLGW